MHIFLRSVAFFLLTTLGLSQCINVKNLDEGTRYFRAANYRDAFVRLKPEAEKGQPDAQYAVGWMFYYGQGVTEDRRRALIWMSRAASAGQVDAIHALEILTHTPKRQQLTSEPPIMNEL